MILKKEIIDKKNLVNMKKYYLLFWIPVFLALPVRILAQSANVTFRASFKTANEKPVPRVYVRFYTPGMPQAVDSVFSDSLGVLEKELPFEYHSDHTGINQANNGQKMVTNLFPNIITDDFSDLTLEYNHPGNPKLFFVDVQGRIYTNHTKLSPGVYFYFLKFSDGLKSEYNTMVIAREREISVNFIFKDRGGHTTGYKSADRPDVFYAEYSKDGFITGCDTISLDSSRITRNCQMKTASVPTAGFVYSGTLQVGKVVLFDGGLSSGAYGEQLCYSWDFGNGKRGQSVDIPHIYTKPGEYTVTLTVSGCFGAKQNQSQTITILPGEGGVHENGKVSGTVSGMDKHGIRSVKVKCVEVVNESVTDDSGHVELTSLPVGVPLHFKITKPGYVEQTVRLTIPEDNGEAFFFAALKKRNMAYNLPNAEYGGEINGSDGASVTLPVEGLLKEDGSVVTGNINVSITPVDVVSETQYFPGTFSGVRSTGDEGVLLSYGVSEFHFQQGEEKLQLAPGKTATIVIPVYTSGIHAGDQVPLWSVNADNGTWIQEGEGTIIVSDNSPSGLAMVAEVGHFSWWNCDDWDSKRNRNGLCWRWECTTAQCYKVKVGCWMSGAQRESSGTNEKKKSMFRAKENREDAPPVFEVREFVSEDGMELVFPRTKDIYVEARAFGESGEMYTGNYTVLASEVSDTFEIELTAAEPSDTLDENELTMNSRHEYYLEKEQFYKFVVNNPKNNLLRFWINRGSEPDLVDGMYIIENDHGIIESGNFSSNPKFFPAGPGNLTITVSGLNNADEGNFYIELFEPVRLMANDSISDSLSTNQAFRFYRVDSTKNTVVMSRFYKDDLASGYGRVKLLSPQGEVLKTAYLNTTEGYINTLVGEESPGYFELSSSSTFNYTYITSTEGQSEINYGDTLHHSIDYNQDINLYHFTGLLNEFISVKGIPDYGINGGILELWDSRGNVLLHKEIKYFYKHKIENEMDFKLPTGGDYYIAVYSVQNEMGTYTLILNRHELDTLGYNEQTIYNISPGEEHYFRVGIPDNKYTHLSVLSDVGSGKFDLISPEHEILTTNITNQSYATYYYGSYSDTLSGGEYFVKVENNDATKLFINIFEAKALDFDEKNKCRLTDTIVGEHGINVYRFTGSNGDGVHGILKTVEGATVPTGLELIYIPMPKKSEPKYPQKQKQDSYSLDSTILYETGMMLDASEPECAWILIAHAVSAGAYDLTFHHIAAAGDLVVDDDFVQFPDANTSSIIAAGYAITNGGDILLANGVYSSSITATILSDSVSLTGQDKDQVLVHGLYNRMNNPAMIFNSEGGTISNISFSTGESTYETLNLYGNGIIAENIDIGPLPEKTSVSGRVKAWGNDLIVRNISVHDALWGISPGGINCVVENCSISTQNTAIEGAGDNIVIKNNTIVVEQSGRAISVTGGLGYGNHRVDSNQITMNFTDSYSSGGIIDVQENGNSEDTNTSYIRNNVILSSGDNYGISAYAGNPPSRIIVENNSFKCSYASGGKALFVQPTRTDAASTIIVRNNVFDGMCARDAIVLFSIDIIDEGYKFAIFNNSFRMAAGAEQDLSDNFVYMRGLYSTFTDTAKVYFVNNIFSGNGYSYLMKFSSDFSLFSDYNVVYNFNGYAGTDGTLIGTSNDITANPAFEDDDLHIGLLSPAVDKGADPLLYEDIPGTDREGVSRPLGIGYDIGAYEAN
jgi:PKD repeat protein